MVVNKRLRGAMDGLEVKRTEERASQALLNGWNSAPCPCILCSAFSRVAGHGSSAQMENECALKSW